jgi:hypothetical protein
VLSLWIILVENKLYLYYDHAIIFQVEADNSPCQISAYKLYTVDLKIAVCNDAMVHFWLTDALLDVVLSIDTPHHITMEGRGRDFEGKWVMAVMQRNDALAQGQQATFFEPNLASWKKSFIRA